MQTGNRPLSFQLRPSVRFQRLPDGTAALVSGYPLRALFIPGPWQQILFCLSHDSWMPLSHIAAAVPHIPPDPIERFLNTLTRKGYVAQEGFFTLSDKDTPFVSVIIPVRNRPKEIADCLSSLARLDYPADKLEVIVVDDASEDDTPEVAGRFDGVRLIRMARHRQASFCRNQGAEAARGEILAFIDSDCLADALWLKQLVPAFRDASLGALGGRVDAACDENRLDRYEKVSSSLTMGAWFKRTEAADRFFYVPACNFLARKDLFQSLGGFRENLHVGEDVDFCWRMQDAGSILEYRPMGRVFHKHRNHLAPFCARRFDYGTSEPVLQEIHTGRVKTLLLPWSGSFFWMGILLSIVLKTPLVLLASAGLLLFVVITKHDLLKSRRIPVTRGRIFTAVIRGYLSFAYHLCSFISRYYLIVAPALALLSPPAAGIIAGMHLSAGIVEYAVRKPRLNPVSFLFFFTLEQVAYQSGVWWVCMCRFNFKPVLPRIVHRQPDAGTSGISGI